MKKKALNRKRIRNILLMISSQLVLTMFVGYWLNTQYQNEKNELNNKLRTLWSKTRQDYNTRQIHTNLIVPLLENKNDAQLLKNIQIDSLKKVGLINELTQFIESNKDDIEHINNYLLQPYPYPEADESIEQTINSVNRIAYWHGIRPLGSLFSSISRQNGIAVDEELFVQMFLKHLEANKMSFQAHYIPADTTITPQDKEPSINRYNRTLKKYEVAIQITDYQMYLIKVIMPQILFALVLLSLTGFALIFTYKGYINQLKLNQLRSEFVNNITHELKIPVATAKVALEALRTYGLKADTQTMEEYLDMMAREMNRLDQLTERVLKHSVFEEERQHLKLEKTELNTFLSHIVHSAEKLSVGNKINITYKHPSDLIYSYIDRVYVEGIIKNLIDNSIKYGGSDVIINIQLEENESQAILIVSDNGPGIKKEYLDKVFDKFFRVPTDDKHNVKGFGLGLSFAALLVRQHKGTIAVKNLPEGGCAFTIKLPKELSD
ncbi:ATP-binding protein [Carboxylicivirga sp. A043]|uniref:sensor histidine kinase n=1 Tax=Carboxylicivirga litoralis TaxID=2816963 RepID=UPI0021CAEB3D|nr:ATP-binding protein [Carboxylicivirga sp. A043]MCU4155682.1 ATP-binding protein [Carboxylicivirga sp. A043]